MITPQCYAPICHCQATLTPGQAQVEISEHLLFDKFPIPRDNQARSSNESQHWTRYYNLKREYQQEY